MDTPQWPQGIGVVEPVENSRLGGTEKKPRPRKEPALNCPRCSSTNTKFCYYNNYSLSQPRYFCKTCRRYWTEGGSLRNVPAGGGSRRNKRSSSSAASVSPSASSKKVIQHLGPPGFLPENPKILEGQDLNLGYNNPSHYNGVSELVAFPFGLDARNLNPNNPNNPSSNAYQHHDYYLPVMEVIKTGNIPVPNSNTLFNLSGFAAHDFKPSLDFSLDGLENGYGNTQRTIEDHHANPSRILPPFEELKPVLGSEFEQDRGQGGKNGCWSRLLAGGSW